MRRLTRDAMKGGHPLGLLTVASVLINVVKSRSGDFVSRLICIRTHETTALLAVLAELLVDEPSLQQRCRRELAERDQHLPRWVSALPQVDVYRAVHRTDALGDFDEVWMGARIGDKHEITLGVRIERIGLPGVTDASALPAPIDQIAAWGAANWPDDVFVDMSLADARAWIESALARHTFGCESDDVPHNRALVKWWASAMPEGGRERSLTMYSKDADRVCDEFFETELAAPFTHERHPELLRDLVMDFQDPLRWSENRVKFALRCPDLDEGFYDYPLEVALDAPDLLRAFIPYAHARAGIREELTARTVAKVDSMRSHYKRELLRRAGDWDLDDAV
ncbi:hypothetical protein [Mycolicibacterium rutilum]|nr:hypothetical protein [Mycolicibacterium rutilum]